MKKNKRKLESHRMVLLDTEQYNNESNIQYVRMRKSGETTRLADEAIQTLFRENKVVIKDHANTHVAQKILWDIVLRRLDYEHQGINNYELDREKWTITIKENKVRLNGRL